jgi:hypothetical protein
MEERSPDSMVGMRNIRFSGVCRDGTLLSLNMNKIKNIVEPKFSGVAQRHCASRRRQTSQLVAKTTISKS